MKNGESLERQKGKGVGRAHEQINRPGPGVCVCVSGKRCW